jgi:hypothetical protein
MVYTAAPLIQMLTVPPPTHITTHSSTTPYLVLHPTLQLLFLFLSHSGLHALPALGRGELRVLSTCALQ